MEVFENWGTVPQNCWFQKVKTDGFCKKNGIPQNHRHIFPHNHRQNPIIIMGSPKIPILRNPRHRFSQWSFAFASAVFENSVAFSNLEREVVAHIFAL